MRPTAVHTRMETNAARKAKALWPSAPATPTTARPAPTHEPRQPLPLPIASPHAGPCLETDARSGVSCGGVAVQGGTPLSLTTVAPSAGTGTVDVTMTTAAGTPRGPVPPAHTAEGQDTGGDLTANGVLPARSILDCPARLPGFPLGPGAPARTMDPAGSRQAFDVIRREEETGMSPRFREA